MMGQESALNFFKDYNGGFDSYLLDIFFGVFLFIIFVIGMLLGAIRGAWFFLTATTFLSIGWATSTVVGKELYDLIIVNSFSSTHNAVLELQKLGIDLQPAFSEFLGFLYVLILVIGGVIIISLPLYTFFGKSISYHAKKMSKRKKGLSIFLGGMAGLLFAFLSGFAIFYTTTGVESILYDKNSSKFKNFYCLILRCGDELYKEKIAEVSRTIGLLKKPYAKDTTLTYSQLVSGIFMKDPNSQILDLDRIMYNDKNGKIILDNLSSLLNQNILMLQNSKSNEEYVHLLEKYDGFAAIYGSNFAKLSVKSKEDELVNWLHKTVNQNKSSFIDLGKTLAAADQDSFKENINVFKTAVKYLLLLNARLITNSNHNTEWQDIIKTKLNEIIGIAE